VYSEVLEATDQEEGKNKCFWYILWDSFGK
jgi:hypothetical protein